MESQRWRSQSKTAGSEEEDDYERIGADHLRQDWTVYTAVAIAALQTAGTTPSNIQKFQFELLLGEQGSFGFGVPGFFLGGTRSYCVDLSGLELTEFCLSLHPQCKLELKVCATMSSYSNLKHSSLVIVSNNCFFCLFVFAF